MNAPQIPAKRAGEVRLASVSFVGLLDAGELLSGAPTVAEVGTTDLTLDQVAVNASAVEVVDSEVGVGQAVRFRVAGGIAGRRYTLRLSCATNATPPQTLQGDVQLVVT